MGLGTGHSTTALRVPEPIVETTQAGHKPWASVWTSHQHTVGLAGTDRHAWNVPGPGGETPGPNSKVCVHICMHTHSRATHTHTHTSPTDTQGNGENGTGDKASQPEQQDGTHTAMHTLQSREETHLGMPRCAGEVGQTETEKAGSSLWDRHPENQTHDAPAVRTRPCLDQTETPPAARGHTGAHPRGLATAEHAHTWTHMCGHTHEHTRVDTCLRRQAQGGRGD